MVKDKILKILEEYREEGILQSELLKISGISKSYLSEILNELEFRGIIFRKRIKKDYIIYLKKYYKEESKKYIKIGFIKALEYYYIVPILKRLKEQYRIIFKTFNNGIEVMKNLLNNNIDLAIAPIPTYVVFNLVSMGSIKALPYGSTGGSYLILKKDMSIEDLDKMTIGTTPLSSMEQFLLKVAEKFKLKIDEINVRYYISADEMVRDFKEKKLDGISIWIPYNLKIKEAKSYRYLDLLELPCCIFIVRKSLNVNDYENISNALDMLNQRSLERNKEDILLKYLKMTKIYTDVVKELEVKYIKGINIKKLKNIIIPVRNLNYFY